MSGADSWETVEIKRVHGAWTLVISAPWRDGDTDWHWQAWWGDLKRVDTAAKADTALRFRGVESTEDDAKAAASDFAYRFATGYVGSTAWPERRPK